MKLSTSVLVGALCIQQTLASSWFSKAIYDKWHQTELERWLSDHDIKYPAASDRKELENTVKENWDNYVVTPYNKWDTKEMQKYLKQKGVEVDKAHQENKEWLTEQTKKNWYETEAKAEEGYGDAKTWVFDTWTDSQLKSFLDYNNIPSPQPRNRDSLLTTVRSNYQTIATKADQTAAYPGNWVYQSWSDSDLKKWLDQNGYPAPQPKNRDSLIAAVRRNSRQASLKWEDAKDRTAEATFQKWSYSDLKQFLDKNGVEVPQNGKRDELIALARRNKAKLTGDTYSASVTSMYGAATSSVASAYSTATDYVVDVANSVADKSMEAWSDSRLKAFLDARGVKVPQNGKRDEYLALARRYKYVASTKYGGWTFETWSLEDLKNWFLARGDQAASAATGTREELAASAASAYNAASGAAASGGNSAYASVSSALSQATSTVKSGTFDTWSDSELKNYLDSYGVKTYQGSTRNEIIAKARRCSHVFQTGWVQESAWQRFQRQLWGALGFASKKVEDGASATAEKAEKNKQEL